MSGYFELLNPPIDFTLAGRPFKARKAGTTLLAAACSKVISIELDAARELASGFDEALRSFFLVQAVRGLSFGKDLENKAMKWLGTHAGEKFSFQFWLKEFQPELIEQDIEALLSATPRSERIAIIELLFDV
jgi:hypothetical protein